MQLNQYFASKINTKSNLCIQFQDNFGNAYKGNQIFLQTKEKKITLNDECLFFYSLSKLTKKKYKIVWSPWDAIDSI